MVYRKMYCFHTLCVWEDAGGWWVGDVSVDRKNHVKFMQICSEYISIYDECVHNGVLWLCVAIFPSANQGYASLRHF